MRIAIFTEVLPPKIDGIVNRLRNTLRELRRAGHTALVFAPAGAVGRLHGAEVIRVPGLPFPPYPELRVTAPAPRILWHLRRFRPDVVHAVGPACLGVWGIAAARALALPLVASYHTDLARYAPRHGMGWAQSAVWPLLRRVHGAAHLNLCPSRATRHELLDRGIDPVEIWRGGVDCHRYHPGKRSLEMRARLTDGQPDRPLVLYAGRVSPEKSIDELGRAARAVPRARLAVVGDGPARADLERSLADLPVVFTGFLEGEALAAAYASADAFFMPSRTETLGFAVLEAMSSGVPVVAADAGGLPDLVDQGENGWLYDPDRPGQAGEALRRLLAHEGRRRFFGQLARKRAEQSDWRRETEGLVEQYRRALCIAGMPGGLARLHRALVR